jgi:bifunctional DNase/RNase
LTAKPVAKAAPGLNNGCGPASNLMMGRERNVTDLVRVELKNLFHTHGFGGGVFLGNDEKTFAIFIGPGELNALLLAGNGVTPPRPLTHNLIDRVLEGFDIRVKSIVITEIVDDAFHATLTLEQNGHEVEIDCRPSDGLVLSVLHKTPIFVTRKVLDEAEDGEKLFRAMIEQAKKEVGDAAKKTARRSKKPVQSSIEEIGAKPAPAPEPPKTESKPKPKNRLKKYFDVREVDGIDWSSLDG